MSEPSKETGSKPETPLRIKDPDVVISGQVADDISIVKYFWIILFSLFVLVLVTGCSSDRSAIDTLRSKSYTNIQTHGYGGQGCIGKNPMIATRFTALDSTGKPVSGSVCSSMFGNYIVVKRG